MCLTNLLASEIPRPLYARWILFLLGLGVDSRVCPFPKSPIIQIIKLMTTEIVLDMKPQGDGGGG